MLILTSLKNSFNYKACLSKIVITQFGVGKNISMSNMSSLKRYLNLSVCDHSLMYTSQLAQMANLALHECIRHVDTFVKFYTNHSM